MKMSKIQIEGSAEDSLYSNNPISKDNIKTTVISPKFKAGESFTINLELITTDNKLYNHQSTLGWYENPQSSIKLTGVPSFTVEKGRKKGTYIITTKTEESFPKGLVINIEYSDPNQAGKFIAIKNNPTIIITSNDVNYFVFDKRQISTKCKSGSKRSLYFQPYDIYHNSVTQMTTSESLLEFIDNKSVKYETSFDGEKFIAEVTCIKAGIVKIQALKFMSIKGNTGKVEKSYELEIIPGDPNNKNMVLKIDKTEITAGESIILKAFLYDENGNFILIDTNNPKHLTTNFLSKIQYEGTSMKENIPGIKVAPNNSYYEWKLQIIKKGNHDITCLINSLATDSIKVKVVPNIPIWSKTTLAFFKQDQNKYETYNGVKFVHDYIDEKPLIKVIIFDQYDNILEKFPDSWNIELNMILTDNDKSLFNYCKNNNDKFLFNICPLNSKMKNWADLISQKEYVLRLNKLTDVKNFKIFISGTNSDPGVSLLPINVQNTIISPQCIMKTKAGEKVTFSIEIRTINPNYRTNVWFVDPNNEIKLIFSLNDRDNSSQIYSIKFGTKRGTYIAEITPFKEIQLNKITISIRNILFMKYKAKLNVIPAEIHSIKIVDKTGKQVLNALKPSTIDNEYEAFFSVFDKWNNTVKLTEKTKPNIKITDSEDKEKLATFSIINGYFKVAFKPDKSGVYKFIIMKEEFSVELSPGIVSPDNSIIKVFCGNNLIAGDKISMEFTPTDNSNNNFKNINDQFVKKNDIKYFYNTPNLGSNSFILGESPADFTKSLVIKFNQKLTKKGKNFLNGMIRGTTLKAFPSYCEVKHANFNFVNSTMSFFNDAINRFVDLSITIPLKENNIDELPKYILKARDIYGNILDIFPADQISKIKLNLYGNNIIDKNSPVEFIPGTPQGSDLPFTLKDSDSEKKYKEAVFRSTPYSLELKHLEGPNPQSIIFPVILLGQGNKDLAADNAALDLSKTAINTNSLSFKAGESAEFSIELRSINNLRKADATNLAFEGIFTQANGLIDGQWKLNAEESDSRGSYIITITGIKTGKAKLKLKVGNSGLINQIIDIEVFPNVLNHAEITSDLSISTSADNEVAFVLIPYDKYNNIADVKVKEINMAIQLAKSTQNIIYTGKLDLNTRKINYIVNSKKSGDYSIKSSLFSKIYTFSIHAGEPSSKYSQIKISPTILKAGQKSMATLIPVDKNENAIPASTKDLQKKIKLSINYLGEIIQRNVNFEANWEIIGNNLETSWSLKEAGNVIISAKINEEDLPCSTCSLTYSPGEIDITKTKFLVKNLGSNYIEVNTVEIPYGSSQLSVIGRLNDQFGNRIMKIPSNNVFQAKMTGNNMNNLDLVANKKDNEIVLNIKAEDKNEFKELIPALNYTLKLSHLIDSSLKTAVDVNLDIIGNNTDAGNGNYEVSNTNIGNFDIILIAGVKTYITIELRTAKNKRYNKIPDLLKIKAVKSSGKSTKLVINIEKGSKKGQFLIGLISTEALLNNDKLEVEIKIDNKLVPQRLVIDVDPASPDLSKTKYTKDLGNNLISGEIVAIGFSLFDKFGNEYKKASFAKKIFGKAIKGRGNFSATGFVNGEYLINLRPFYPPIDISVLLYYTNTDGSFYSFTETPITGKLKTVLDIEKTEIHGSDLTGVRVDRPLGFFIILKDTTGYCFEEEKVVKVSIIGPYQSENKTNNSLVTGREIIVVNVSSTVETSNKEQIDSGSCKYIYNVEVIPESLKYVGYYQINVFIEGENNNEMVKSQRNTLMQAGDILPSNSLLNVPILYQKGNALYNLDVNKTFILHLITRDKFKNVIADERKADSCKFNVIGLDNSDYKVNSFKNMGNGTFELDVKFFKAMVLKGAEFIINTEKFKWSNLGKRDCPNVLKILPGNCSSNYPNTNKDSVFIKGNVNVGFEYSFNMNCYDQFNNKVDKGGNTFSINIIGNNVNVVKVDNIPTKVVDNKDGSYTGSFTFGYGGNYNIFVMIDGEAYDSFEVIVNPSMCPLSTPVYCLNTNKCVKKSYFNCNYPELSCSNPDLPYKCSKNGVDTCVKGIFDCDCEKGFSKCPSSKKCVPTGQIATYCPSIANRKCSGEAAHLCSDGSGCRINSKECPSQKACPPGSKMCFDGTCRNISSLKSCPKPKIEDCSTTENPFRCEDMSCVADPNNCPTRITCSGENQVICPDNTCVDNIWECRNPSNCGLIGQNKGWALCPDQSCRPSLDSCPNSIVCSENYALCKDGSCKLSCKDEKTTTITKRILAVTNNAEAKSPGSHTFICPGKELVTNEFLCPTLLTCPANSILCPDLSCASSMNSCVLRVCPIGKYYCPADGKCVSNKNLCATRSSCPKETPVKCENEVCVGELKECSNILPCPKDAPFRCGTGDCRVDSSQCPTGITCPPERPIKCVDGDCVTASYHCSNIEKLRKCKNGEILCAEGSCALSFNLCPTSISCKSDEVKCWDNSCQKTLDKCVKIELSNSVCPSNTPLHCSDGSCAKDINDCPTVEICPEDSPIKCDDGTCQQALEQCASNTQCTLSLMKCPDGSCSSSECGTSVTCSSAARYKCYDNTCKIHPLDCPIAPKCPANSPILCSDGTCKSQRVNCKGFGKCPVNKPVRCPNFNCYASSSECEPITGCPPGYVYCEGGSCAKDIQSCPVQSCSLDLPHMCKDGFCVSDKAYCDKPNGCPYNKGVKCANGLCVSKESDCPKNIACPDVGYTLCPDGSCVGEIRNCPSIHGCPSNVPFRCAAGNCIDPTTTKCNLAICPKDKPIKCLDGLCVDSTTSCKSTLDNNNLQCQHETNGNLVPCADGRCVSSADQCRPVYNCAKDNIRCGDGSCRKLALLCPIVNNTCPPSKSFRCEVGVCAENEGSCPTDNGCPLAAPVKCANTGTCAKNITYCDNPHTLFNKCPVNLNYKCPDTQTCVKNYSLCSETKCNSPQKPYFCELTGECVFNKDICKQVIIF